jgi:hypothetical protein
MELKKAYQMVFADLRECPMFQGRYDTINGNPYFMSGISTVMEVIANRAYDDDFAEKFSNEFCDNMLRSRENV